MSAKEIASMSSPPETAIIIDNYVIRELNLLSSYSLEDTVFVTLASGIPGLLQPGVIDWPKMRIKKPFCLNTLAGAVVNALSVAWGVSIEDVLKVNDLEREENVIIGREGKRELRFRALKISKP